MSHNKTIWLLVALTVLQTSRARAQSLFMDGTITNRGGTLSDWSSQAHIPAGSTYQTGVSAGYAYFEHYGPSGTGNSSALQVDGVYDATAYGRDFFYGPGGVSGQQGIGGSQRARFLQLLLHNGSTSDFAISNTAGIYIEHLIAFNNGITITDRNNPVAGSIFMGESAVVHTTGTYPLSGMPLSNTRYVNGYVTRIGGTAFMFPVGSQNADEYRWLTTGAAANGAASAISIAYFTGSPEQITDPTDGALHPRSALGGGLLSVTARCWWDFEVRNGVTGNHVNSIGSHALPTVAIPVMVSLPDMTGNGGYNTSDMVLVGWDAGQAKWIPLGGINATGNTAGSTLSGTVPANTDITAISIGSVNSLTLPVHLTSFSAVLDEKCTAHLNWKTASESSTRSFGIGYSTDGRQFSDIGNVLCFNSSTGSSYKFSYGGLQKGAGYFRLRMLGENGSEQYSEVVQVKADCHQPRIMMMPNPVQNTTRITGLTGKTIIRLYDASGQLLKEAHVSSNSFVFDVSRYPAATYILKVYSDGQLVSSEHLIKQ